MLVSNFVTIPLVEAYKTSINAHRLDFGFIFSGSGARILLTPTSGTRLAPLQQAPEKSKSMLTDGRGGLRLLSLHALHPFQPWDSKSCAPSPG